MIRWHGFFGRNKLPKFLSLLLAVALWLAVGGEERTEATLSIPLEFTNLASDLTITSDLPSTLQVKISGPRSMIRSLSQSRLTHSVDLSGLKAGPHVIPLGPQSFPFPRGIEISRIQPNPLTLTLSQTLSRTLSIQPVVTGNPAPGYEIKEIRLRPAQVTVKGPAEEISGLKALATLPIDVSNLSAPTTLATDLDFKSLHLSLVRQIPILAEINIAPKQTTRKISGIPIMALPHSARLSPSQVTAILEGPEPQLKDLQPEELKASVDTAHLKTGRHRLKISLTPPPGLKVRRLEPETVTAVIRSP